MPDEVAEEITPNIIIYLDEIEVKQDVILYDTPKVESDIVIYDIVDEPLHKREEATYTCDNSLIEPTYTIIDADDNIYYNYLPTPKEIIEEIKEEITEEIKEVKAEVKEEVKAEVKEEVKEEVKAKQCYTFRNDIRSCT